MPERVRELTDGAMVPVVYDSVGKDTWADSLACLAKRGLMVSFGNASGPVEGVNLAELNKGGSLVVRRSVLDGNDAQRAGGGIESSAGSTEVFRTDLLGNDAGAAPGNGGGLHLTGAGTVDVAQSTVSGNSAVEGGGLWNSSGGTFSISDTVVEGNTATGDAATQGGGGVYNDGVMTITGSTIDDNTATGASGSGGGVLNNGEGTNPAMLTIDDTSISLVPPERYGFTLDGACQNRMFTCPSRPRSAAPTAPAKASVAASTALINLLIVKSSYCG